VALALAAVLVAALVVPRTARVASRFTDAEAVGGNSFSTAADFSVPYDQAVVSDNPVGYYRLGEASGTTAADASDSNLDGTYVGGPLLGRPGALAGDTAVEFRSGVADHVAIPYGAAQDVDDVFSIELWVKRTELNPSGPSQTMICRPPSGVCVRFEADEVQLYYDYNGVTSTATVTPPITDTSSFHHVVITKDGSRIRSYLDGALNTDVSVAFLADMFTPTGGSTYLGTADGSDTTPFPGLLDEVAIYDYELTQAQVTAHYTGT